MGRRGYRYSRPDPEWTFNCLSIFSGTALTLGLIFWMATKGIAWIFPWAALAGLVLWLVLALVIDARQ